MEIDHPTKIALDFIPIGTINVFTQSIKA